MIMILAETYSWHKNYNIYKKNSARNILNLHKLSCFIAEVLILLKEITSIYELTQFTLERQNKCIFGEVYSQHFVPKVIFFMFNIAGSLQYTYAMRGKPKISRQTPIGIGLVCWKQIQCTTIVCLCTTPLPPRCQRIQQLC